MSGRLADYLVRGNEADLPNPVVAAAAPNAAVLRIFRADDTGNMFVLDRNLPAWIKVNIPATGWGNAAERNVGTTAGTVAAGNDARIVGALQPAAIGNTVQGQNANLQAVSGLTTATNQITYWTGSGAAAQTALTAQARTFLAAADQAAMRGAIGAVGSTGNETVDGVKSFPGTVSISGSFRLTRDGTASAVDASISSDAGQLAIFSFRTLGVGRWFIGKSDVAGTGSNTGDDLVFRRRNDAGANLGDAMTITRATGLVTAPLLTSNNLSIGSTIVVPVAGAGNPSFSQHGTGTSGATNVIGRWSNDANGSQQSLTKSRSATIGSFSAVLGGDTIGSYLYSADDGTSIQTAISLDVIATENFSATARGSRFRMLGRANGTIGSSEFLGGQPGVGLTYGGAANVFLDADRLFRLRPLLVAVLPTPGTGGRAAYATNCRAFNGLGAQEAAGAGTGSLVTDNGTAWKIAGTNVTAVA